MVSSTLHRWGWSARFVLSLVIMTWSKRFTEAADCPAEKGWKCHSLSSSVTCTSGRNVEITDAYYVNVTDRTLCDENCTATQTASPSQCKIVGGQCRQKMDRDGLGSVYATCNAKLSHCDLRDVRLPEPFANSNVYVEHTCISKTKRVDPCRLPSQGTSTNASVLLLDYCSGCNSTCEISPINKTKPFSFKYIFHQKGSPEQDNDNIAEFKLVTKDDSAKSPWLPLHRESYTELANSNGLQKLQIRFQISSPANMTRHWISFYDLDVSIACSTRRSQARPAECEPDNFPKTTSTISPETTSTVSPETTSTVSPETTSTVSPETTSTVSPETTSTVSMERRRQHRPEGTPKVENLKATSSNRTKTSVPSADDREYSECFPTASANTGHEKSSSAPGAGPVVALKTGSDAHCTVTCQPGSDPGEDYRSRMNIAIYFCPLASASVREANFSHCRFNQIVRNKYRHSFLSFGFSQGQKGKHFPLSF
ncbi:hypothetical protein BaRGS_00020973 [Batillaria attramentaria]|uniref:Uncharacterized protein n=1 Tax=Batillaria attramentaria TaxID=370345 RepID=A0ABD0KKG0_9CAEN